MSNVSKPCRYQMFIERTPASVYFQACSTDIPDTTKSEHQVNFKRKTYTTTHLLGQRALLFKSQKLEFQLI